MIMMDLCTKYATIVPIWVLGCCVMPKLWSYVWCNWCKLLWYELECELVMVIGVCVRETVPESACLAQAS